MQVLIGLRSFVLFKDTPDVSLLYRTRNPLFTRSGIKFLPCAGIIVMKAITALLIPDMHRGPRGARVLLEREQKKRAKENRHAYTRRSILFIAGASRELIRMINSVCEVKSLSGHGRNGRREERDMREESQKKRPRAQTQRGAKRGMRIRARQRCFR